MERLYFVIVNGVEQVASLVSEKDNILTVCSSTGLHFSVNKDKYTCPDLGTYIYNTSQKDVLLKVILQQESIYLVFENDLQKRYKDVLNLISGKLNPQEIFKFESLLEEIYQKGFNSGCNETTYSQSLDC